MLKDIQVQNELTRMVRQFLNTSIIYECLPQSAQILVFENNFSFQKAIDIMNHHKLDQALVWNAEKSQYDYVITLSNIVEYVCQLQYAYQKDEFQNNNQKQHLEQYQYNIHRTESDDQVNDALKYDQQRMNYNLDYNNFQWYKDIMTLKQWHYKHLQSKGQLYHQIISVDINQNLDETINIMLQKNLHRIVVRNLETKQLIGFIKFHNIMTFLIQNIRSQKNFSELYIHEQFGLNENIIYERDNHTVLKSFQEMINKKISSMLILNENKEYLGIILMGDIFYILRNKMFEILNETNSWFINYKQMEANEFFNNNYKVNSFYTPQDSLNQILTNIVFAPGNRLINLDSNRHVKGIITIQDIFKQFVGI